MSGVFWEPKKASMAGEEGAEREEGWRTGITDVTGLNRSR